MGAAIGLAGPVMGLLGGAMSYGGAQQQGNASYNSGMMQAMVAQQNSLLANRAAGQIMGQGEAASYDKGLEARARLSGQETEFGAGGVDSGSGSAAKVLSGIRQVGLADALNIRASAANSAYNKEVEATSDINQAALDVAGANNARRAARMQADAGLINGASTAGTGLSAWQQKYGGSLPSIPANFFG